MNDGSKRGIIASLRNDEGWTLIEALISLFLITILFLGFTVSLLAFREWINRSWAIRVMDQYANDVFSRLDAYLRDAHRVDLLPPQNGLGRFQLLHLQFDIYDMSYVDTLRTTFSADPQNGISIAEGNAAPKAFDEDVPFDAWKDEHNFRIERFDYIPGTMLYPEQSVSFRNATGQIKMTIGYERPREVSTPEGTVKREYVFRKEYTLTAFLKNYINKPD